MAPMALADSQKTYLRCSGTPGGSPGPNPGGTALMVATNSVLLIASERSTPPRWARKFVLLTASLRTALRPPIAARECVSLSALKL